MKELIIIQKYAGSVVDIIEDDKFDSCLQDIEFLDKVLQDQPQIIDILHTKLVDNKQKSELIEILAQNLHYSEMWKKFFVLLINNFRFRMVRQIFLEIKRHIFRKQDKLLIKLILAHPQEKEITDKIIKYLETVFKKKLIPEINYDKDILGGFYAETTDMIVDGSLRQNLNKFVNITHQKKN